MTLNCANKPSCIVKQKPWGVSGSCGFVDHLLYESQLPKRSILSMDVNLGLPVINHRDAWASSAFIDMFALLIAGGQYIIFFYLCSNMDACTKLQHNKVWKTKVGWMHCASLICESRKWERWNNYFVFKNSAVLPKQSKTKSASFWRLKRTCFTFCLTS